MLEEGSESLTSGLEMVRVLCVAKQKSVNPMIAVRARKMTPMMASAVRERPPVWAEAVFLSEESVVFEKRMTSSRESSVCLWVARTEGVEKEF